MAAGVKARTCDYCGKPFSVTWYRVEVGGKTTTVKAHLKCFNLNRPGKAAKS